MKLRLPQISRKQSIRMMNEMHGALQDIAFAFRFDPFSPFKIEDVVAKAKVVAKEYYTNHPESAPAFNPRIRRDAFDMEKKR